MRLQPGQRLLARALSHQQLHGPTITDGLLKLGGRQAWMAGMQAFEKRKYC
jgi:hypothetical protein